MGKPRRKYTVNRDAVRMMRNQGSHADGRRSGRLLREGRGIGGRTPKRGVDRRRAVGEDSSNLSSTDSVTPEGGHPWRRRPRKRLRRTTGRTLSGTSSDLREAAKSYTVDDIRSGGWFVRFLLGTALETYAKRVNAGLLPEKSTPGCHPDIIVERQMMLAKRYAAIEGG